MGFKSTSLLRGVDVTSNDNEDLPDCVTLDDIIRTVPLSMLTLLVRQYKKERNAGTV